MIRQLHSIVLLKSSCFDSLVYKGVVNNCLQRCSSSLGCFFVRCDWNRHYVIFCVQVRTRLRRGWRSDGRALTAQAWTRCRWMSCSIDTLTIGRYTLRNISSDRKPNTCMFQRVLTCSSPLYADRLLRSSKLSTMPPVSGGLICD